MRDIKITIKYGEVVHLYKMGVYLGGLGSGVSFTLSKLPEDFMLRLDTNNLIQLFCDKLYFETLEGEIVRLIDFKEVD